MTIRTVVAGDHVFHKGVPATMQPNETFGHRREWSPNCTICREAELAEDARQTRESGLADIEDARLSMLRDHVLGHEDRLGVREWTGLVADKLEEANREFDVAGPDETAADLLWRYRSKLIEAGAVLLGGIEAISRLTLR